MGMSKAPSRSGSRPIQLLAARQVLVAGDGDHADGGGLVLGVRAGRAGMRQHTTVHGLCRSTFSTWANDTGAARPDVIEACLAHREGDRIRAAYNRASFDDERRELLRAWSEFLAHSADVIRFEARAA